MRDEIITFFLLFFVVFLVDYIFIKRKYLKRIMNKKKKKKNFNDPTEIIYLVNKFKLDKEKLPLKKLLIVISLINAFIISLVAILVLMLDIFIILQLLIGFILLFALIYALYELLGRYLERRGYSRK